MKFYMMVGLPGSGKSTIAKEIAEKENAIILSSDEIRKELYGSEECQDNPEKVFDTLHKRVLAVLNIGKSVIYDATNISSKRRIDFLNRIKKYNIEKIAILAATPYDECLRRNLSRDRKVPEYAIKKMYMNFNIPCKNEGFSDVKIVYPELLQMDYPATIVYNMRTIPHDNPHHLEPIGQHMVLALEHFRKEYNDYANLPDLLVYAIMLHDIGKPFTKVFKNAKGETTDIAHYYNHNNVGAYDVLFINIPEETKIDVALLIQYHMNYYGSWKSSEKSMKRDREFLGETLSTYLDILHECDLAAHIENR